VITAVHTLVYAEDPDAARAFFRDVLGWPHIDAHDGWLIFRTGPSELGVHPTAGGSDDQQWSPEPHHQITLMCDDIEQTVIELAAKGAKFAGEVRDEGFGRTTVLKVPGAGDMLLYQARHQPAYDL
jgi:catechol 2,3-dioxygenase-like lactoylglutathione lyase family enzyme